MTSVALLAAGAIINFLIAGMNVHAGNYGTAVFSFGCGLTLLRFIALAAGRDDGY